MSDKRVLQMTLSFDQDWYCPWGHACIISAEQAITELKEFLEEHDLDWDCSVYDTSVHRLEIRRWDMSGDHDHHFYGLCPVQRENPSVMYGDHPKFLEESCWQILLDWKEVFTTTSGDDDDENTREPVEASKD